MNDFQRLNLMMSRGAKLDDIITAIVTKGGTVADPQKVAEIVSAINAFELKQFANGTGSITDLANRANITIPLSFSPEKVIISAFDAYGRSYLSVISKTAELSFGNGTTISNVTGIKSFATSSQTSDWVRSYYVGSISGNNVLYTNPTDQDYAAFTYEYWAYA